MARRIGISAPSIYRHFADRHAILLAITADAFAGLANRLDAQTTAAGPDPVAMPRAGCAAYLDFAVAQRAN